MQRRIVTASVLIAALASTAQAAWEFDQVVRPPAADPTHGLYGWGVALHGSDLIVTGGSNSNTLRGYVYDCSAGPAQLTQELHGYGRDVQAADGVMALYNVSNELTIFEQAGGHWAPQQTFSGGLYYANAATIHEGKVYAVDPSPNRIHVLSRDGSGVWGVEASIYSFMASHTISVDGNKIASSQRYFNNNRGMVVVHEESNGAWPDTWLQPQGVGGLGYSVMFHDGLLYAGAIHTNGTGVVVLFDKTDQGWQVVDMISPPTSTADEFGYAMDIDGDTMAVGAPGSDEAFVYRRRGDQWVYESTFTGGHRFGEAIDIEAGRMAVGAPDERMPGSGEPNAGAVYLYNIPEPASLGLVLGGVVLLVRRRR